MSQNSTKPTIDENRAPIKVSPPLLVPIIPMYYHYGNNNSVRPPFYVPNVYSNVPGYALIGDQHHGNMPLNYNTIYTSFYPNSNNIIPPTTYINNTVPLMPPSLLPSQPVQYSRKVSSLSEKDVERNKNLNIRECQSPVIDQTKTVRSPLQTHDTNYNNNNLRIDTDSSSISPLVSLGESNEKALPSIADIAHEIDSDGAKDDFLTFIEQKTKTKTAMPELNPFANEFCFDNSKIPIKDSSKVASSSIHGEMNESQSSYRLLFDNLIEKSLESIEAIKKSRKKTTVNDMAIQCDPIPNSFNRSTQTSEQTNNFDLIEEYSSRTVKLMDKLLVNFRNIYQNTMHEEYHSMAQTCDELRHLVLFIRHIVSSSTSSNLQNNSSIDLDNPFNSIIQDVSNDIVMNNPYQTSSQIKYSGIRRGTYRLRDSTSNSSISSVACQQIDQIATVNSKRCIICLQLLGDTDDIIHASCRSWTYGPAMPDKDLTLKDA